MKTLKNFEQELNKCSKCGLCETVCPIYKLEPNECAVSKGKFIMLHGVTKGDLKLSKNINKYLDMCLKCGKCTKFCPSGIDAVEIFNIAKHEYMKTTFAGKIINFLQSKFVFSVFMKLAKLLTPGTKQTKTNGKTLVYFKGCVNNVLPNTDKYISKIFKNKKFNIIEPNFECCGMPFLSEGNWEEFERCAYINAKLIMQENYDFVVTDCASCEDTIMNYHKYIKNFGIPLKKSVNWGDIIASENIKFLFNEPITVTFHKPCHLKDDSFFPEIIKNCKNVTYTPMDEYDECCGCAGSFILKNRELSKKLSVKKAQNIIKTKADYVITTCPACILGIKQGLHLVNSDIKVLSILEWLHMADNIQ